MRQRMMSRLLRLLPILRMRTMASFAAVYVRGGLVVNDSARQSRKAASVHSEILSHC